VKRDRWNTLTPQQKRNLLLCPDFVVELFSPSDSLEKVRAKMKEYMDNGARLGWLINPKKPAGGNRSNQDVEILNLLQLCLEACCQGLSWSSTNHVDKLKFFSVSRYSPLGL